MDNARYRRFWEFIAERQSMFAKRRAGQRQPWTDNGVLANWRFTNVYRAADRASQFLIGRVLYAKDADPDPIERVYRALLFRMFNTPEAYGVLTLGLGTHPSLSNLDADRYYSMLRQYELSGHHVWSHAYMITPPPETYGQGDGAKILGWLHRLEEVKRNDWPRQIVHHVLSPQSIYELLLSLDTVGPFFAMQWTTDLGYALPWVDENRFVQPGPGALRGLLKLGMTPNAHSIEQLMLAQHAYLPMSFLLLGGSRSLSLMDIQNCLCEFDKYLRVVEPGLSGKTYKQMKRRYNANLDAKPLAPMHFPPHWGLPEGW